jgi:hypothetical protein
VLRDERFEVVGGHRPLSYLVGRDSEMDLIDQADMRLAGKRQIGDIAVERLALGPVQPTPGARR